MHSYAINKIWIEKLHTQENKIKQINKCKSESKTKQKAKARIEWNNATWLRVSRGFSE